MKQKRNYFNMNDGGILFFLYLILSSVLASVVMAICSKNGVTGDNEYYSILSLAINQIAIVIAFFAYTKMAKINFLEASGIKKKPSLKQSLTLIGVAISMMMAFLPIAQMFIDLLVLGGFKEIGNIVIPSGAGGFFAGLIFAVIMPAVLEEFIYRGALLNGLKQKSYIFAVVVTSLIFSLAHGSAVQTVHQFLASIVICLVVLYGGSLWYGIILHFINNLFSLIMNYIPIDIDALGYFKILTGLASFVVGMLLLISFMKLFVQQSKDRKMGEKIINVYPKGKFVFIIGGIIDSICKFFRCLVNKEDRKLAKERFEETVGYLDDDYIKQESVMGNQTGVSPIIIGIILILAVMWIVALAQAF